MSRFQRNDGSWYIGQLKEIQRGDEVYVTSWRNKYVKTIVKRVRTVECATIITVEKREGVPAVRYAGFHTSSIAQGVDGSILTLEDDCAREMDEALREANHVARDIKTRAEALEGLMKVKKWLKYEEKSYYFDGE